MSSGILGAFALPSNTYTVVYSVPAGMLSTVNISFASRTANNVDLNLALEMSATNVPNVKYLLNSGFTISAREVYERKAIVLGAGQAIVARASSGVGLACVVWGMEESAS